MAERANAASTAAAAVGEQKYHAAVNILKTDIHRAKGQQSKAGGEASAAYKRIENLGVNKKAASFIASLLGSEVSIAEDVLRSVINLATAANLMPQEDLVDLAERVGSGDRSMQRTANDADGGEDDDDDAPDDEEDDEEGELPVEANGAAAGSAPVVNDTPDKEWNAAAAKAAKAAVGERKSPAEARAARKSALRAVPDAMGPRVH